MPLSIPALSKLIQGASDKLIESEEKEASKHVQKSGAYYDEAAKAYRSGHPEPADRASEKGDEESKKADDIDEQIKGKKEMQALVQKTIKAAQKL